MMVKKLMSLLLVVTILGSSLVFGVSAAVNSDYSTGGIFDNHNKYASQTYSGDDLGCTYTKEATTWKVWSPEAEKVELKRYTTGTNRENGARVIGVVEMEKSADFATNGVWEITLEGDHKNEYYTYLVTVKNTSGVVETNETQDIYSKAVGANGDRSMVVDLDDTDPEGWDDDKHIVYDNMTESTVWELHIRDFSCDPDSGISEENRGNYLAFTEGGTTISVGADEESITTGIDYLVEQGVNCVQLMPFADFDQVDEINGASPTKRNWGYNPKNYNVPDGSYSSNPYDGNVRINEVKQMVQALHDRGISVVMDVVYNHTAGYEASCFTKTVPGYYYRMYRESANQPIIKYHDGSGQGCELSSENAMTRNFIIQSMKYWVEEYHIDGFRFDLMACIDVTTLNQARDMLNGLYKDGSGSKILMYGEPWTGGSTGCTQGAFPSAASKLKPGIGMFNAEMRDAATNIEKSVGDGWVTGATSVAATVKHGILADQIDNTELGNTKSVTYAECHDKYTLWDKIVGAYTTGGEGKKTESVYDNVNSTDKVYTDRLKLGGALFMTSQGIVFYQAGTEFARTKKGQENSYNSSDDINQLDWSRISTYKNVVEYYKGLNRINEVYSPFSDDSEASENTIKFFEGFDTLIGYTIDNVTPNKDNEWGKVAVLLNNGASAVTVPLGEANWDVVANAEVAGVTSLEKITTDTYTVPARSAAILVKSEGYKDFSNEFTYGTLTTNHYVGDELVKTTTAKYRVGNTYHALKDKNILTENDVVRTEGVTSGEFKEDLTVSYYYEPKDVKAGKLIVKYVDDDGKTVAPSLEYILNDGDEYDIPVCAVEGYELKTCAYPANTKGVFDGNNKVITFTYVELESQVTTIHYYNANNWKKVLCYAYTDDGEEPLDAWNASNSNKKAVMTDEGDNWYTIKIPIASCKVMFYSFQTSVTQEPGKNEPGYAVSGECRIKDKVVEYSSTIVTSYIDIDTGAQLAPDKVEFAEKKSTDQYTTNGEFDVDVMPESVNVPANAEGFYQPGVTNVVYLYKNGEVINHDPNTCRICGRADTTYRYRLGDVNHSGKVTISDVTYIQLGLVDYITFGMLNLRNGDVDLDNELTIKDASYIQRYLAGMDDGLDIGRRFNAADWNPEIKDPDEEEVETYEVKFTNNMRWSDVTVYYWEDDKNPVEWPGVEIELTGDDGYGNEQYTAYIPVQYTNIIFVGNGGASKTVDLKYAGQAGFWVPGRTNADGAYECESW